MAGAMRGSWSGNRRPRRRSDCSIRQQPSQRQLDRVWPLWWQLGAIQQNRNVQLVGQRSMLDVDRCRRELQSSEGRAICRQVSALIQINAKII
jgi:hypothetical protein